MEQLRPDFPVLGVEFADVGKSTDSLIPDATADLTQPGKEPHLKDPLLIIKEHGASNLAIKLLLVFGHFLLWPFVGGILLIVALSLKYNPDVAAKFLVQGYLPLLERIGDLALRIFGPLLGFVLGYYFGTKGQ